MNVENGAFHCFGCDAKGGDLIVFVRLRDHCDFKTACQRLGAWDEGRMHSKIRGHPTRFLRLDFVILGNSHSASVLDEPRNYTEVIRRFLNDASDRLNATVDSDEQKICWEDLAAGFSELRELADE